MPKIEVRNLGNKVVETIEIPDSILDAPVNEGLMHDAVRQYLASRRAGTHSTKTRGEVAGSGRKPWRQKGTGRARVGEIRNPLWRAGGTVFGPKPRDYGYRLPRKMFRVALRSALTTRFRESALSVTDSLEPESHRTAPFAESLAGLGFRRKVLLVDDAASRNLMLASRNLPEVSLLTNLGITPYQVLDAHHLVFTKAAIQGLSEVLTR
jgi:large subunit ribosomal protein L4